VTVVALGAAPRLESLRLALVNAEVREAIVCVLLQKMVADRAAHGSYDSCDGENSAPNSA
jgi:hypothetical protein